MILIFIPSRETSQHCSFPKRTRQPLSIANSRLFSNESNLTSDEESDLVIVEDDDG